MRIVIRAVAILAALSFSVTLAFIALTVRTGGLTDLLSRGAFGAATAFGWGVTLTAGPLAAVELWRFRERGRRAGIVMFGSSMLYYVIGALTWRSPSVPIAPILLAIAVYAVPLAVLLLSAAWFRERSRPSSDI